MTTELFARIFHASPAGISLSTLEDARILEVNAELLRLTGYGREELVGAATNEAQLWADPAVRESVYQTLRKSRSVRDVSVWLRRKNGERFHALVSFELLECEGQTCVLSLGIGLTQHERLSDELRHAQKMDALGRLAGGVAHDFNNILTAISGYCELTVRALPGDAPALGYVMHVLRAAQKGTRLTRQLLAFGRRQILQPRVLDLNEIIRRTASMLRHLIGEDVTVLLELADQPMRVLGDQGQLDQILLNLALNARDAMPRGGRLTLRTVSAADGGKRWVRLTVSDSGCGMSEETVAKIFEPFFTTKELGKGTGLGLSTVQGIVEQSGGRIHVDSTPGVGTTIDVLFPEALDAETRLESPSHANRLGKGGAETILLVEDDDEVREFVEIVLKGQGYHVLTAADGAQALRVANEQQGSIDLLLSDVVMPNMSGRDLAERLAALRPELAILHMSGYPGDAISRYGNLPPDAHFLQKPFTAAQLSSKVRCAIDRTPASSRESSRSDSPGNRS